MKQLTLNQIKKILTAWFKSHADINSTFYEDDFSFNAERKIIYPVSNIEYLESNINGKKNVHSYKLTLADLLDENITGHADEIYSDMMLIAQDFIAWASNADEWEFPKSTSIKKFVDDADDRTAGIVFTFQIETIMALKDCATPSKIYSVYVDEYVEGVDYV